MTPSTQTGWFDSLTNALHWHTIKNKFYENQSYLLELGLSFGIGFLVGFFLKKWGKFFAIVIGALVVLGLLQQLGFISVLINWAKVQETFGVAPAPTVDASLVAYYFEVIKAHMVQSLLFVFGFIVGLRIA